MRLVRFSTGGGAIRCGLIQGDEVVALGDLVPGAPDSMKDVIAQWDSLAPKLKAAKASGVPLSGVKLHAPIPDPEKVMAIGLNYADHVEEAKSAGVTAPESQIWFCKMASSINDPNGDVEKPKSSAKLDYEVELVAIIGKGGRHISKADAPGAIFGYAVGNDFSARDWQLKTHQWVLGKSFDTHAPIGPCIVTADEVGEPHRLAIKCWVNGDLRQNSNTKHLIFNVWDQLEELSQVMALKPGDILFTGTPGGVGMAQQLFLQPGDVVRCEIEELGVIENRIVAEA